MKSFLKKLVYTLTITLIFGSCIYTVIEQQIELDEINEEKEKYTAIYETEQMEYERLLETKENINSDNYIEEVAREKLGLVMPYETIFVDASI